MKVSWFDFLARGYRATHPLPLYDERHIADLEEGEPLDVFIPLIEKDIPLLHHCIPALHAFLQSPDWGDLYYLTEERTIGFGSKRSWDCFHR